MPSSRRSVRAQMLMSTINQAMACASRDDYLNAVTNMRAAAAVSDYKLPVTPAGVPDIVRGMVWLKWRSYYHNNFPTVFAHVNNVLKSLGGNEIEVEDNE